MKDLNTGNLWLWERGKFMNRRYMMQEMYQQFLDEDDSWKKVAKDQVTTDFTAWSRLGDTFTNFIQRIHSGTSRKISLLVQLQHSCSHFPTGSISKTD